MSIWILAIVLCVIFGAIGFFSGAIRTAILWLGVVAACMVTGLIAPKLVGLMPKIGIKNPIWVQVSPYLIVFSVLVFVLYGISFAVHHKVALIYKYKRDDYTRLRWESMNHHVGLSIGLLTAVILFFAITKQVYAAGYLTAQVAEDRNNPFWLNFITDARNDMQTTGLDKALAALDKTSPRYYQAADIIGLIYHNPALQARLADYPPFLGLSQNTDLQEIGNDKDYKELIFGRSSFGKIIEHPNTQRVLANDEILQQLKEVDLKDFRTYLETGKSPKYEDEKILGRWILDKDAVLTRVRKSQPDLKAQDLVALRRAVEILPDMTLINTLGNKTIVKSEGGGAGTNATPAGATAPAAPAAPQPIVPDRYRQFQRPNPQQRRAAVPAPKPPGPVGTPPPVLHIAGEGEWKQTSLGEYQVTVNDPAGKPQTLVAKVNEDELTLNKGPLVLIFNRAQ